MFFLEQSSDPLGYGLARITCLPGDGLLCRAAGHAFYIGQNLRIRGRAFDDKRDAAVVLFTFADWQIYNHFEVQDPFELLVPEPVKVPREGTFTLMAFNFPLGWLSREMEGSSNTIPVMFSFFKKMNGKSSTPILTFLAVRKGVLLKDGSSAMLMFAAETCPLKMN